MLKIIGAVAAVVAIALAGVLAYAATRPDSFRIARSTTIHAPPERVFPLIEDFRQWRAWSPYETLDADLARTYGGSGRGAGATYAWSGRKAGAGSMEILRAPAPREVVIRLDFTRPMKARNEARFTLEPAGENTKVTWAMQGRNPYIAKLLGLVFDMDAMIGKDFETGLARMKAVAEKG